MKIQGDKYEQRALQFLKKKGLSLRARNTHSRFGEIDLIMEESGTIIFIEVRYRASDAYGSAGESVTKAKQQKIIKTAKHYLTTANLWHRNIRFDVVAISPIKKRLFCSYKVDWIRSAFCVPESDL